MKKLLIKKKRSRPFKFDLKMKLSLLFLFSTILNLWANDSYSQKTRITLDMENTPIEKIIDEIEGNTEFRFVYNVKDVDLARKISVKAKKNKIENILNDLFSGTSTSYKVKGKQVILFKKTGHGSSSNPNAAVQETVTGVVTDGKGMPLPGVTVTVKGTNRGTATNLDGEYEIAVDAQGTLVFSFIGFKKVEVAIAGRREINLSLVEEITALDQIEINAGYYNTTRRESTGNISRVTAEEIELQPVVSPLQALQGRMAGVEVIQTSGVPGNAPIIRIRGQNSLRNSPDDNGNLPLYIIDGVPVNANAITGVNSMLSYGIDFLSTLNLSDIQSIEVLKDADATAIYGSRGANGVILITTKSGSHLEGLSVQTRLYRGVSEVSRKIKLLNTNQYLQLRKEAFVNDGLEPTAGNAPDLVLWDQDRYTDWQEEFLGGTSNITNVNISASGGTASTSFRAGVSYHQEGSVFPGDLSYRKATGTLSLQHRAYEDKLQLNFSSTYGLDKNNLFHGDNFIQDALFLPPNAPAIYNEDGSLNWENNTWDNPFAVLENSSTSKANNLISNLGIRYRLFEELELELNAGFTNLVSSQFRTIPKNSYRPDLREFQEHSSTHLEAERESWIVEPQLNYSSSFLAGTLSALLGLTFQEAITQNLSTIGAGYPSETLIGNLSAAEEVAILRDFNTKYRYNAVFGRLGYNLKEKYFLNLTGRRDGSSRFGPEKMFANFGAIGGAWIFSEEPFLKNSSGFLSFGKIRGSYGITGSDHIPDYGYLDAYEATPGPGGLYPTQLTNPDYSWEENRKLEAAVDLGFLDGRINFGASWYRNRSSNQLVGFPLPSTTGFSSIQANMPATVQNTGWEIELSTINFENGDLQWQSFLNLTIPETKLLSFSNIEETSYANIYRVGHPLNIALLYSYQGIDPETGLYVVRDINDDGRLDYEDRVVIKDRTRQIYGGFSNNVSYKSFSLSFLWEFVSQDAPDLYFPSPGTMVNQPVYVFNSLQRGNAELQKVSQSFETFRTYSDARNTELFYHDASYLRLKNLSITYRIPGSIKRLLGLNEGNIFMNAQNLLTITDYRGLDSENPGAVSLPPLRTITGGIQINF